MKAALVLDQFADASKVTEEMRPFLQFKAGYRGKMEAVFPMGTVFVGEQALRMCRTGQCAPADDECAKALGWTPDQLKNQQDEYKMNTLGINRKEDRELWKAGVIAGYDNKLQYIKGPNWDKYQQAKEQIAKEGDDI